MTKISGQTVREIVKILETELKEEMKNTSNPLLNQITSMSAASLSSNSQLIDKMTETFNTNLIFDPESNDMLYTIRDPVSSSILPCASEILPRAFVKRLEIKSRCFDACMVIDGGLSFKFNDGTTAILELFEGDALRTVVDLRDDDGDQSESEESNL